MFWQVSDASPEPGDGSEAKQVTLTVWSTVYVPPPVYVMTGGVESSLKVSPTRPELATRTSAVAPAACANARGDVSVTPVPVAPAVPTEVIVNVSGLAPVESIVIVLPAK